MVSTPGEGQAKSSKVAALGADPEHAYERSDCDPPSQALDGLLLPAGLINVGVSALNVVQGVGLDRSQGGLILASRWLTLPSDIGMAQTSSTSVRVARLPIRPMPLGTPSLPGVSGRTRRP